jgi:two-component system sensor histidine kinase KdpD
MALLLEVLSVAAWGDWLLAVVASLGASMALSWYYIESIGSLRITTPGGWVTFSALLFTALGGSRMAVAAQRRAAEAERRREEMARLHRLGQALMVTHTWREAAEAAVQQVVDLFGVSSAAIRCPDGPQGEVRAGAEPQGEGFELQLDPVTDKCVLELGGRQPSFEVRSAMAQLIGLALDRASQTEERGRMEGVRRSEELRGMVLSSLAQNFRTPLTSIKVASSALRGAPYIPDGPGKELVYVIDEEADRLDRVLGDSLKLGRIESWCANPRMAECSLSDVTAAVMLRVARYVTGRNVTVKVSRELPRVAGDAMLLEQMLFEVVDNAWKYSTPGSAIEIEASEAQEKVLLTVRSRGSEILDYERDLIFAKFYRGAVHRSQVEGTGLGLAIARAIADAHHGSIWVDAEAGGHAFTFSLPARKPRGISH